MRAATLVFAAGTTAAAFPAAADRPGTATAILTVTVLAALGLVALAAIRHTPELHR